jgi:preprotein translocase subunit SecA
MSRFHVSLPVSQIKKMSPQEVEEKLRDAAKEQITRRDVSGLLKYLEPLYAETELANWAKDKFGIEVDPHEFLIDPKGGHRKEAHEIEELITKRAREAYARRELEYPVDHTLTFAFGGEEGTTDNPYASDYVRGWIKAKYGVDMTVDQIRAGSVRQLRDKLIGLQEKFLKDGELDREVDAMVKQYSSPIELAAAFNARFGTKIKPGDLQPDRSPLDVNATLSDAAHRVLRRELSDLEQFVLISIFDQSWKDHLWAMDALKGGIGLQAFAERDPRILFKKEGYEYFQKMMIGVRDKVTDMIFKARVVGPLQTRSAYRETAAVHQDTGGYGVAENVQATADAVAAPQQEAQASGGGAEAGPARVKTITRDAPKVGRNDPCPCGSGKKYKHCHGANE